MEETIAEPYKHLARSQGGLWSHQGTILEPTSISGKWSEANGHTRWNSLWHWFILRSWRKSGHCCDLADQNWGHSGFPTNKKKKIFCTGKAPCQRYLWLQLPLLSLQAAESMKRKRKITINLNVSLFSPSGLKYPTKDLLNPSYNPHRLPIYNKLGPYSVSMGKQRIMLGHMKRLKV